MIRTLLSISLLVAGLGQALAQNPRLAFIQMRPTDSGTRVDILCTEQVSYSHRLVVEPPGIVVYLNRLSLSDKPERYIAPALRNMIRLERYARGVKVFISLPKKMDYEIHQSGGLIWIQWLEQKAAQRKEKPKNGTTAPFRSRIRYEPDNRLLQKLSRGERISIDVRDAELGNVLRMLARQNGLNIVAPEEAKTRITVSLRNVTVEQALESILRANGYGYRIEKGVILVKPLSKGFSVHEMETRVYRLRYIDAHNLQEALLDLKSPEGRIKVLTSSFHNRKDVYDVNSKTAPRRETKYWLRSSVLLVTDYPENLEAMDQLVAQLDVPVPQVMIEARLIETSPQHNTNIGIDWSKALAAALFDEIVLEGGTVYRYSTQTQLNAGGKGLTFGTLTTSQLNAVLNFLQTKMNSRLLSNPRILAMDNEPSDISVGTNVPIPQITRGVGGQGDMVTFSYKDVNITLRVIPHVVDDEMITMYVNPIIEEITGQVTVEKNSAPITSRREVDTVVKVKSGDTIVIGGMIKEQTVVRVDKIWLLGSLPLIGHVFRNKRVERQQTDLLIFITPRIVEE